MANVNLVLLEDVENLGLAGENVHVAPGYARNFLLPRKLAAKATPGTLRLIAARKAQIEERRSKDLSAAKELAEKLAALQVSIPMQAAADDQLFGSVSARAISEKLAECGFEIEHNRIKLDPPIKVLGEYTVEIKLHQAVTAELKVWVVRG